MSLIDQLIAEIKSHTEEINSLKFGELILKIQDGLLIKLDLKKSFKPKK